MTRGKLSTPIADVGTASAFAQRPADAPRPHGARPSSRPGSVVVGQARQLRPSQWPLHASASAHALRTPPATVEMLARRGRRLALSKPGDAAERQADAIAARVMRISAPRPSRRQPDRRASRPAPGSLDPEVQSFMEQRFQADFRQVRIHTDGSAERMCRELGADAFTVGDEIYFAPGEYAPHDDRGRRLIAHGSRIRFNKPSRASG